MEIAIIHDAVSSRHLQNTISLLQKLYEEKGILPRFNDIIEIHSEDQQLMDEYTKDIIRRDVSVVECCNFTLEDDRIVITLMMSEDFNARYFPDKESKM